MNVGIFLGSFDPIHIGHLSVIATALDSKKFDLIEVIPAWKNVWKNTKTSYADRFCMAAIATEPFGDKVRVRKHEQVVAMSDVVTRGVESWKVLDYIKNVHKENNLFILVSKETLFEIPKWDKGEEILQNYKFVLVDNYDPSLLTEEELEFIEQHTEDNLIMPKVTMSSTSIRNRIKDRKEIYPYVPSEIVSYINKYNLYRGW